MKSGSFILDTVQRLKTMRVCNSRQGTSQNILKWEVDGEAIRTENMPADGEARQK